MRRMVFILILGMSFMHESIAQDWREIDKIMELSGAESEADLHSEEVEHFSEMLKHPLRINRMSRSSLLDCGLFSPYQVASFLEYRQRFGAVASLSELASVDGFSKRYVDILGPFISMDNDIGQGKSCLGSRVGHDISLRGGYRFSNEKHEWQYGFKYGLDVSDLLSASIGMSVARYSFSLAYDFRKSDAKIILGDFNARFGQGLTSWNGVFLSSLTSPSGFMKKASGVTQVRSFTGSSANTGVASEWGFGNFVLSTAVGLPKIKDAKTITKDQTIRPVVNFRWLNRLGSVGVTAVSESDLSGQSVAFCLKSSVDASLCIRGVNLFSEAAYDWSVRVASVVAGTDFSPGEYFRVAALSGWVQGQQCQFAVSGELTESTQKKHRLLFSTEGLYYYVPKDKSDEYSLQVKSQIRWDWQVVDRLFLKIRLTDRFRTWGFPHRAEVRAELGVLFGSWVVDMCAILLKYREISSLVYLDNSYKTNLLTLHLRLGLFDVGHWDDRIYVYEYDIPGSFNVPAYYGRGVWASSMLSWKISRSIRLYARASFITYPFMPDEKKKPGRAELKIQSVFRF